MALNVPLLRSSFELVMDLEPTFIKRFYEILFARHREARPLFSRNLRGQQEKMLTDALVAVLDHLEDAPWLSQTLGALGAKHVDYGVTPEMYGWVGDALLATLSEVAGPAWNSELHAAWSEAYGAISGLMIDGARSRD